jgi:hypothetical protein
VLERDVADPTATLARWVGSAGAGAMIRKAAVISQGRDGVSRLRLRQEPIRTVRSAQRDAMNSRTGQTLGSGDGLAAAWVGMDGGTGVISAKRGSRQQTTDNKQQQPRTPGIARYGIKERGAR